MLTVDLSNIILKNNIKTRSQLLAFTKNMKDEGERALPTFIIKNIDQSVKIMRTTWEMEESVMKEKRSRKSLIEILKEASLGSCKIENYKWLMAAFNTLSNNNVQLIDFCQSIRLALEKGRGKKRNIMIVGPSNCGKTFMLKPLTNIFDCFSNLATGSFAWIR
jgi:DNA replication protein DnaC